MISISVKNSRTLNSMNRDAGRDQNRIMKYIRWIVFVLVVNLVFVAAAKKEQGFAIVELFTSEGCSSCPPADELVARIQKEDADRPVYILSFHVDYWNNLGWKDPFSNAAFSRRQKQYAEWLNLRSVYTPQVIVNGRTEFVGSDEGKMVSEIQSNLQKKSATGLEVQLLQKNTDQAGLQYDITNSTGNISLILAVVQKSATIKVERGENGGRTLSHVQIVRNFQEIPLLGKKSGTTQVILPSNMDHQEFEIIGFLQNTDTGEIIGASKLSL
jgi:hypothetical protein